MMVTREYAILIGIQQAEAGAPSQYDLVAPQWGRTHVLEYVLGYDRGRRCTLCVMNAW
jgi:hypothetical protein